jgi:hypothetical protein
MVLAQGTQAAQQAQKCVVEMISEFLALFPPEEMQLLYRQRRCGRHRHTLSCFSRSCSAEPFQLAPVQLECETPRMTTRMRPCSPQDEWRDLKWEFLTRLARPSHTLARGNLALALEPIFRAAHDYPRISRVSASRKPGEQASEQLLRR